MNTQTYYQKAIIFAGEKHGAENQTIPGTELPYVIHLSNVAMEILLAAPQSKDFDLNFAVQLALLHDCLEDTPTSLEELTNTFGAEIAQGVQALTKNGDLPKSERMPDSLSRIKSQRKEVWAVKIADRITNLQAPPKHWTKEKCKQYQEEAKLIASELSGANEYLEQRIQQKIQAYTQYLAA